MIRLLYVSRITPLADEALEKMLAGILASSRKNNLALGITGILLHGGGMFMQILEGPDHSVLAKYIDIVEDKRHGDCRIVLITTTEERAFADWAMALLEISPVEFQDVSDILARRQETLDVRIFSEVIRSFMGRADKK